MTYLSEEQFFELFHTFDHTAFRLEVRESYVGVDAVAYRQFLSGDLPSLDSYESWMQNVREQTASGKRIERARVVLSHGLTTRGSACGHAGPPSMPVKTSDPDPRPSAPAAPPGL